MISEPSRTTSAGGTEFHLVRFHEGGERETGKDERRLHQRPVFGVVQTPHKVRDIDKGEPVTGGRESENRIKREWDAFTRDAQDRQVGRNVLEARGKTRLRGDSRRKEARTTGRGWRSSCLRDYPTTPFCYTGPRGRTVCEPCRRDGGRNGQGSHRRTSLWRGRKRKSRSPGGRGKAGRDGCVRPVRDRRF